MSVVAERIRYLLETVRVSADDSYNIELLNNYFDEDTAGVDNRNAFLCSSDLFEQGGTKDQMPAQTLEERQESAKLHCLWGRPIDPVPYTRFSSRFGNVRIPRDFLPREDSPAMNTRLQSLDDIPVHMVARGKVYDLSEYTLPSLWGPFMEDGSHRVDWEKIEAIMVVLGFNLARFTERSDGRFPFVWKDPWTGATPQSFISAAPPTAGAAEEQSAQSLFDQLMEDALEHDQPRMIRELDPELESLDPYGITGTWMRVVCFLDYNDLYNYNFHSHLGSQDDDGDGGLRRRPIDTEEGIITLAERVCHLC